MGRTRVDIKKIEDRVRRQTTFTKRRQGLFKKAGELGSKCGANVAVIVFSLAGNVYAFGDPNVDTVLNRYEASSNENSPELENGQQLKEELEGEYKAALARSDVEKSVAAVLETVMEKGAGDGSAMWGDATNGLGLPELEQLESTIKVMADKVVERISAVVETDLTSN